MTNYRYTPTLHAIERAKLRYGISAEQATKWFNDMMAKAKYVVSSKRKDGRTNLIYEYGDKRLIVDSDNRKIVTIKPVASESPIIEKVKTVVDREYRKAQREFKRKQRAMNIQIAELNLEIAKLAVNKAKARSQKIQAIIQSKIDDLKAKVNELETEFAKSEDEFETIKRSAEIWAD